MKLENKIKQILNDTLFIKEMNNMMLNWSLKSLIEEMPSFDFKPTVFTWGESKWGESPWYDGKRRYIEYTNRWIGRNNSRKYRIYNDSAFEFKSPQISRISVLNDPLDTIWLHKNLSGYSFIFLRALMSHKICGSYMSPACIEELYMVSNYSRVNQRYIEFNLKDIIKENCKEKYFMGHVLYPSQKNFNIILRNIRKSLNIESMDISKTNIDSLALFYCIEIVISCFVKEYAMRKEKEFRTISFDGFASKPIDVPISKDQLHFKELEDKNKYYKIVDDIKGII